MRSVSLLGQEGCEPGLLTRKRLYLSADDVEELSASLPEVEVASLCEDELVRELSL